MWLRKSLDATGSLHRRVRANRRTFWTGTSGISYKSLTPYQTGKGSWCITRVCWPETELIETSRSYSRIQEVGVVPNELSRAQASFYHEMTYIGLVQSPTPYKEAAGNSSESEEENSNEDWVTSVCLEGPLTNPWIERPGQVRTFSTFTVWKWAPLWSSVLAKGNCHGMRHNERFLPSSWTKWKLNVKSFTIKFSNVANRYFADILFRSKRLFSEAA